MSYFETPGLEAGTMPLLGKLLHCSRARGMGPLLVLPSDRARAAAP
jgi:hypothetical protein